MGGITFCLLGVATPSDLIRNVNTTPFNIGYRIELTDFTEAEAEPLLGDWGATRQLRVRCCGASYGGPAGTSLSDAANVLHHCAQMIR